MNDQAQRLRDLITKSRAVRRGADEMTAPERDTRIITVSSGKGGVGKTNVTVNLSLALQEMGFQVAIIDADLGLANVDLVLGLITKYNLSHYISDQKSLEEITLIGPGGIKILSGGSGVMELINLADTQIEKLVHLLTLLNDTTDYIFVDTGAGMNRSALSFIEATQEIIMVVTPDPTSITDAYAVIKNINYRQKDIKIVVNMADSSKEAVDVFNKLHLVADKFLDIQLQYLGYILSDHHVVKSIRAQQPFFLKYPNSSASQSISVLAHQLEDIEVENVRKNAFSGFLKRLFNTN